MDALPRCPYCRSEKRQTKAGQTKYHSPRFHCTARDKDYTPQPKQQGYDAQTRQQAVALVLEGLSLRAVARIVAVNPQSVANWFAAHQATLQDKGETSLAPQLVTAHTVELDEVQVFIGARKRKKRWVYIATAVDRLTRCLVGWAVVEERTFDTLQPVIDQVPRPCRQFYSGGLNTYPTLLYYEGKHEALPDKSQTYSVEGSNAEIRHYLGRLHRRSRCFCRSVEALRRAFWLFAYCYNRRCLFWQDKPKLKQTNIGLAQFLPSIV